MIHVILWMVQVILQGRVLRRVVTTGDLAVKILVTNALCQEKVFGTKEVVNDKLED